jgi:hypothetical protein
MNVPMSAKILYFYIDKSGFDRVCYPHDLILCVTL